MLLPDIFDFGNIPEKLKSFFYDKLEGSVQQITASFGDTTESFFYENIPDSWAMQKHGNLHAVKLKSDSFGYVLSSLLNTDFDNVTAILETLRWDENSQKYIDPPINSGEIHNKLLSISDIFSFYLPNEWEVMEQELGVEDTGVPSVILNLKKFIEFCEKRQMQYNSPFFSYLVSIGYFEIIPSIIMPTEKMERFEDMVDDLGRFTYELDEIYDMFLHNSDPASLSGNSYLIDPENRLRDIAMISFNEVSIRGKVIRRCKNCGKYFIPGKRSDTLYCDNPSPEDTEMTCKEYGTRRLWYEKQKEDELAILSRKIASSKYMLAKRNPDQPKFKKSYQYFKEQRLIWMKSVKDGSKSREEYKEWLLYMQSQKRIPEAFIDSND